jgi:hypothetical protein
MHCAGRFDLTYAHDRNTCQLLQVAYTFNFLEERDYYHTGVIRSKLIRHIAAIYQDVDDETLLALKDSIPTVGEGMWQACGNLSELMENVEWVKLPMVQTMQRVISRITSRVFVGPTLCS